MKPWRPNQLPILGVELGHLAHLVQYSPFRDLETTRSNAINKWPALGLDFPRDDFLRILLSDRCEDRRTRLPTKFDDNMYERFPPATTGWNFGCTSGKNVVLVPSNAKKKDLICVPVGSSTPFVLRPTGKKDVDGSMQYYLVGRCYVHKFMDGETMAGVHMALKNAERDGVSDEKKEIFLTQLKLFILI